METYLRSNHNIKGDPESHLAKVYIFLGHPLLFGDTLLIRKGLKKWELNLIFNKTFLIGVVKIVPSTAASNVLNMIVCQEDREEASAHGKFTKIILSFHIFVLFDFL